MHVRELVAVTCVVFISIPSGLFSQTIPQETHFRVRLVSGISTRNNVKGDRIAATVLMPEEFKGSLMEGVIQESKSSGKVNKTSTLRFTFNTLVHQGKTIPVRADVVSFYNSKGQQNVDEEGQVVEKSRGTGKAVAATAIAAGIGALIGGGKGAVIGAGAGLAAGILLVSVAVKGPNVSFDTNSEFDLSVKERPSSAAR
jgi:hypothetical protein